MIYHFSGILFFTISFGTSTNFISLIPVPGAFNNLLPYQDEAFSEYRTESVQEFRFVLSGQIRHQVFYAIFMEKARSWRPFICDSLKLSWDTGNEGYVEMISYWGVRFILICMMNTQWGTLPGGKCHRLFTYSSKETSGCQKYFHNLILKHNILV